MNEHEAYFARTEISQSDIQLFMDYGPSGFKHLKIDGQGEPNETVYTALGGMVHTRILEPKDFDVRYIVRRVESPTSKQQKQFAIDIAAWLIKEGTPCVTPTNPFLLEVYEKYYSVSNMKPEKVLEKGKALYGTLVPYIQFIMQSEGRTEVKENEYDKSQSMVDVLKAHPHAKKYLFSKFSGYKIFNEQMIIWEDPIAPGRKLRSKLDRILVNIETATCFYFDYKTTSAKNRGDLIKKIRQFRYPIQLDFYESALKDWLKKKFGKDFTIKTILLCQSTTAPYTVYPVTLDPSDLTIGNAIWKDKLKEIDERYKSNRWEEDEYYSDSGLIKLKVYE